MQLRFPLSDILPLLSITHMLEFAEFLIVKGFVVSGVAVYKGVDDTPLLVTVTL